MIAPPPPPPKTPKPKYLAQLNDQLQRISIASLDDTSLSVTTHFNPKEVQIERTTPWVTHNYQDNRAVWRREDAHVDHEYVGALPRTMTLELMFDRYEATRQDSDEHTEAKEKLDGIEAIVEKLDKMASVTRPDGNEVEMRPHQCVVAWGAGGGTSGLRRFRCVIDSLTVKYTMFWKNGTPCRAICTVKLTESNAVKFDRKTYEASIKKPK